METGTIQQVIKFNAKPELVYELIMNQELHSAFTHSEVEMSKEADGLFKIFDGYCTGHNIELKEGKEIKQAWRFDEEGWPDDHYSTCTFIFNDSEEGCELHFSQINIPKHKVKELSEGWHTYYWQPMKNYLGEV